MTIYRDRAILKLAADRRMAHAVLFAHRHQHPTPAFHGEIIDAFHSSDPRVVVEGYRGSAKSTIGEDAVTLRSCLREFKNCIIVGSSEARAIERLHAIKHEYDANDYLIELFGKLVGPVWQETKIELSSGIVIQAFGRGQSLRGAKHLDQRPDFCLLDDLEDDDTVNTPEARRKIKRWLYRTLIPALAPDALIRYVGNRLDREAVIVDVSHDANWKHLRYPIRYRDKEGKWISTWPDRYPLKWIEAKQDEYVRQGLLADFKLEYMCESDTPEEKPFRPEQIKVRPRTHIWEPVTAMFDPAFSVARAAATTGYAAWSWVANRLIVWDGWAKQILPDELVKEVFACDEKFHPVLIGVEENGLDQWLMQPLRHEQNRRGHSLPLKGIRAPVGKLDFIRALQPLFYAGEVEFAQELPTLKQQLLNFPQGRIDAPNALAYARKLRPGIVIYDDFSDRNVVEDLQPSPSTLWLVMNATGRMVTAVLLQYTDSLRILADWWEEGDAGQVAGRIVTQASIETARALRFIGPPVHFDHWNNVGLRQALAKIPAELRQGADPMVGREEVRRLLRQQIRGNPALLVSSSARWTLNGFAGGYAREVQKGGLVSDHATPGIYRTLMEGIESFAGLASVREDASDRADRRTRVGRSGTEYVTTMPGR